MTDRNRGQLLLAGAVVIATVVIASVVLLNTVHSSPSVSADVDAKSLQNAEQADRELRANLETLFLTTAATASDDSQNPLPYVDETAFEEEVGELQTGYNRILGADRALVANVSYQPDESRPGAVAYNRSVLEEVGDNTNASGTLIETQEGATIGGDADGPPLPVISLTATGVDGGTATSAATISFNGTGTDDTLEITNDNVEWDDEELCEGFDSGTEDISVELSAGTGLFGATSDVGDGSGDDGTQIRNVVMTDADITGERIVGILAGQVGGGVFDSRTEGDVVGTHNTHQQVGGMIGDGSDANLDNRLVAQGTVESFGSDPGLNREGVGGLVGRSTFGSDLSTGYTQDIEVTAPAYVGGITGTSSYRSSAFEQMYSTASVNDVPDAGAIVGRILHPGDTFDDSVFWDTVIQAEAYGEVSCGNTGGFLEPDCPFFSSNPTLSDVQTTDWQGNNTAEMQGPSVLPTPEELLDDGLNETDDPLSDTEVDEFYAQFPGITRDDAEEYGDMTELDWDIWEPVYESNITFNENTGEFELTIENEDYPIFEWESEGFVTVDIDETTVPDAMMPGEEDLEVEVEVENTGDQETTDTINLLSPRDGATVVDTQDVTLGAGETKSVEMTWETRPRADRVDPDDANGGDAIEGDVTALSSDTLDREEIQLNVFEGNIVRVDGFSTNETVEALNEQGLVEDIEISVPEDANEDLEDVLDDGRQLVLSANDRVVGALDIDAGDVDIPGNGNSGTVKAGISWVPLLQDIGTTQLELEFVGQGGSATGETTVISPAEAFVPGETLPVDADLEIITGG